MVLCIIGIFTRDSYGMVYLKWYNILWLVSGESNWAGILW